MDVALSMGSYRHQLVDAAQLSACIRCFKYKLLKTELVIGLSVMSATANLMATVKKLSAHARGTLTKKRDNAMRCQETLYQLLCEIWEGQVAHVSHSCYVHSQTAASLSK